MKLSKLNDLFKEANTHSNNSEFALALKIYKKIKNELPKNSLMNNYSLYNNMLSVSLKLNYIKDYIKFLKEVFQLRHHKKDFLTIIWKSIDEITKIRDIKYNLFFSKEPLIYNNLLGQDNVQEHLYKPIIDKIENKVDYYLSLAKQKINLFNRYKIKNDEEISEHVWKCLQEAYKYSKQKQYQSQDNDFINIFRKPLLYSLSYIHVNNRKYLEKLSSIYRNINPKINYVSDRCKNNVIMERKRIKVGFVSVTFLSAMSSVFRDRSNIIKFLPNDVFEKVLIVQQKYHPELKNKQIRDLVTALHKSVDKIVELPNVFEESDKFVSCMSELDLDILVFCDIGMSTESVILAHHRFAPVQINTWGHSMTSGISTIDYYISSKLYEIPNAQEHYSEKLIAMDSMCTSYFKVGYKTDVFDNREKFDLPEDKYVLFCMQNTFKVSIEFMNILKMIHDRELNIVILLLDTNLTQGYHNFLKENFGEDFYSCLRFMGKMTADKFHNIIFLCDLLLDTYPFGGCNTDLEGFLYNKISVTKPSEFLAGRFTYGFYKKMGIMDAIVSTDEEYCSKVLYYLHDIEARREMEKRIQDKKECLYGDKDSVKEWKDMLIKLAKPHVKMIEKNYKPGNIYSVDIYNLLSPTRFDIIFKYIYAKYRSPWAMNYYKNHIKVLNGGYEMITDVQEIEKNSTDEFVKLFLELIDDISENGVKEPIPIIVKNDKHYYPISGSHRLGIYLALGRKDILTKVYKTTSGSPVGYPSFVFKNRNSFVLPNPGNEVLVKMSQIEIDYATLEYVKLKKENVRIMTIFSKSNVTNSVIEKLDSFGVKIVSYSEFFLSSLGCYNLIQEMYLDDKFVDIKAKTHMCFPKIQETNFNARIGVLVIESCSVDILKHLSSSGGKYKSEIRKMYGNYHAIHVTDNENDTTRIAKTMLHKNSRDYLNVRKEISDEIDRKIENYKLKIIDSCDDYCLTDDLVMELYNLKRNY